VKNDRRVYLSKDFSVWLFCMDLARSVVSGVSGEKCGKPVYYPVFLFLYPGAFLSCHQDGQGNEGRDIGWLMAIGFSCLVERMKKF